MTTFALDLLDYTPITGALVLEPVTPRRIGYRVLHVSEGGRITPDGMPCVVPSVNVDGVQFTADMQRMSYALMIYRNPSVTRQDWRVVFGGGTAFTTRKVRVLCVASGRTQTHNRMPAPMPSSADVSISNTAAFMVQP